MEWVMASEFLELSGDQLKQIAANASSLWERAEQRILSECPLPLQEEIAFRLKEWLEVTAEGDRNLFEKRLSFEGFDLNAACSLLGSVKVPPFVELPPWVGVLNEVLWKMPIFRAVVLEPKLSEKYKFLNKDIPIAFEELLLPFIDVAKEKVAAVTSGKYHLLADKARASLERALLQRLSGISSRVLLMEFRTFLACQQMLGRRYLRPAHENASREEYLRFVKTTYEKSWAPLFEEYCVLSRLMVTSLIQWVEAIGEFLERFEKDLPELRAIFLGEEELTRIADVQMGLSDFHNGGRTVILIEFNSGAKIVYKPKSLNVDTQYFRFVDWLNGLEQTLVFRCLKIVNRGSYGWEEFVENLACKTEEEVRRYYWRTGMFLCLVYAFNGMDFHFENLVACGEHPVPVDLETIYHHSAEGLAQDTELTDVVAQRLRNSVLSTHLLPNPVKSHGQYIDISGIARSAEGEGYFELLTWKNVNTDDMDYSYQKIKPQFSDNLPRFEEKYLSPDNYVGEIVEGFRKMYRLLLDQKEVLLAEGSPLHQVFRQEARFIFRATTFYLSILKNAFHPDYLHDGVDFTIQLDILVRYFLKSKWKEKPKLWPFIREEIEALWKTDIPRFAACGDQNSLMLKSGELVSDCFLDSAWNRVQKKIRSFSEGDLQWQVSLIKGSMDARDAKRLTSYSPGKQHDTDYGPTALLSKEDLLVNAVAVAREVQKAAIYSERQEPSWLVLEYLPGAEQFALRSIKYDLYNGRCGIALFFAALEKALPGSGYREMAYSTLALVRRWLGQAGAREIESLGIGGFVGVPSLIYSLVRIGTFLGDADLLEEAKRAASRINEKQIHSDHALDVIGGSAGTILCLLACHEVVGGEEILDRAVACGHHLLAKREANKSGFNTWATLGKKHLTGFSHGAAGIAYALLKLYQETGEREFYDAAQDGINFESHEFVSEMNNWPDHREFKEKTREPAGPAFMVGWCHGAPGIGLARLGALGIMDSQNIRNDIQCALITTSRCNILPRDHICCGNAGLAETLLMAGIKLSNPEWTQEALRIMSNLTVRAKRRGSIAVTFKNGFFNPSLFQGAAGVGYQFLRLACPDKIHSLLLLE
jgi:type 2 lantibiotic biosynthesis protein LanM